MQGIESMLVCMHMGQGKGFLKVRDHPKHSVFFVFGYLNQQANLPCDCSAGGI